ncbi:MAG: hypothetical protein Q9166_007483 [cf. Caloplaca sp. 2 TL-2023]
MLITPRTYQQLQSLEKDSKAVGDFHYRSAVGWQTSPDTIRSAQRMLLIHQVGSVKIGEVVRYTLTYTPSLDRILPSPAHLFVKIKNTSAIALRAAYLRGPYTLYTACYPSTFDPNCKRESPHDEGTPEFEPNLKAGGSWSSRLTVPENIRETAEKAHTRRTIDGKVPSFTWIIEVASQVIFSTSATVHFELLIGRDEKAVELGFSALTGKAIATPGQLQDHQQGKRSKTGHGAAQAKGVFSNAIELVVDDTASLWNKPALPEWHDEGKGRGSKDHYPDPGEEYVPSPPRGQGHMDSHGSGLHPEKPANKRKKVHLVVLTHGLHSNLGADMLYLKESIDAAAKQARESARARKAQQREGAAKPTALSSTGKARIGQESKDKPDTTSTAPLSGGQDELNDNDPDEDDEEEIIVRGFSGNAVRTERGIQYLGKRLAKFVLSMTYPDQPFLPVKQSMSKSISRAMTGQQPQEHAGLPSHGHSSIHKGTTKSENLAYKITSISFIGHSLGGLTQTYAVAYIHKHSPRFFEEIKPINFITLASPFLGLSNENPLYVKFALDFGLVGRTGQDLGLTWRAPAMVRSGWGAMIGGIGNEAQRAHRQPDPGSKPLLRILPTGPAHHVLKLFRNRTLYSNVVNDGIVPLRTSCLLFLDWSGLGRVEKARRENGLVGTMAGWGWSELTGANSTAYRQRLLQGSGNESDSQVDESGEEGTGPSGKAAVPQPEEDATKEDTIIQSNKDIKARQPSGTVKRSQDEDSDTAKPKEESSPFGDFLNFGLGLLRPSKPNPHPQSSKNAKIYKRGQTMRGESDNESSPAGSTAGLSTSPANNDRPPGIARGFSMSEDPNNVFAPPKTTVFESAGDILNPPLPSEEFIINPESRPRTIFHDRVYHPDDIPAPPLKKRSGLSRSFSGDPQKGLMRSNTDYGPAANTTQSDTSSMKVEEKIARAYHRDLSWRKVLVRLEPDAHNNLIVRRMFANAYGWPVVKHLVDTHFADTYAATTADVHETNEERAKPMKEAVGEHGEEVNFVPQTHPHRTDSEVREAKDEVVELKSLADSSMSSQNGGRRAISRQSSAQWDDAMFDVTDDEDELYTPERAEKQPHLNVPTQPTSSQGSPKGTSDADIAAFLTASPTMEKGGLHLEQSSPPEVLSKGMPQTLHGYSTTVGLGKSMEEQMNTLAKAASRESEEDGTRSPGVSEAVTRLSIGKGKEH